MTMTSKPSSSSTSTTTNSTHTPTSDLEAAKSKVVEFHTWVRARLESLGQILEDVQQLPASEQRAARCELNQCRNEVAKLRSMESATEQYLIALMRDFTAEAGRRRVAEDFEDS